MVLTKFDLITIQRYLLSVGGKLKIFCKIYFLSKKRKTVLRIQTYVLLVESVENCKWCVSHAKAYIIYRFKQILRTCYQFFSDQDLNEIRKSRKLLWVS